MATRDEEEAQEMRNTQDAHALFAQMVKRAGMENLQYLVENFGLVRAVADGSLIDAEAVIHAEIRRGRRYADGSVRQWKHLQLAYQQLLEKCDASMTARLLDSEFLLECVVRRMFRNAIFARERKHVRGWAENVSVETMSANTNLERDFVGTEEHALAQKFTRRNVKPQRKGGPRGTCCLIAATGECEGIESAAQVLAAHQYEPATVLHALAYANAVYPKFDHWDYEDLTIVVPGTVEESDGSTNMLALHHRPKQLGWRLSLMNVKGEWDWFRSGVGRRRWLLGFRKEE